jgi:uncharacterized protein YecE (DUF72 family)
MALHVGTSGFNYPEWRGSFYPERLAAPRMLPYYAERLDAVEINATFYRMPVPATLAAWDGATPPGFVFALKAPRRITHLARLRGVEEPVAYFLETVAILGPKLGPILFQLPPSFRRDVDRLAALLALLPASCRFAVEFRHASWLDDEVYGLLARHGVALCVADTGQGSIPVVPTAEFGYLRLRDEGYGDADLERWARVVRDMGERWRDAYVFFKHEERGTGPAFARRFRELAGLGA